MVDFFQKFDFLGDPYVIRILGMGLLATLVFSIISVLIGSLLAIVPALMRLSKKKYLRIPATVFVDIVRGTPLVVQVLVVYAIIQYARIPSIMFMGVDLGSIIPGLVGLIINCSAYESEIIRAGILAVDKGQTEAARSLGMTKSMTMRRIILPQAIKNILPAMGNELVTIVKETSIFNFLGIAELMYQINIIKNQNYRILQCYIVAGVLYMLITIPLSKLMNYLERRMHRGETKYSY